MTEGSARALGQGPCFFGPAEETEPGHWRFSSPGDRVDEPSNYAFQVACTGITCVTLMDLGDMLSEEEALERASTTSAFRGVASGSTTGIRTIFGDMSTSSSSRPCLLSRTRFGEERRQRLRKLGEDLIVIRKYQSPDGVGPTTITGLTPSTHGGPPL